LSASVLPFYGVISEFKKKDIPAVQLVLRDSIKVKYISKIKYAFFIDKIKIDK
jgi:hypothetical protein